MRNTPSFIVLTFVISVFVSCEKAGIVSQQELIEIYIDERMEESSIKFWKSCYTNIIKDAEAYVDSIIFKEVNFNVGDTIRTPGKPIKPTRPFDTLKLDSTPIIPILMDTSEIKE